MSSTVLTAPVVDDDSELLTLGAALLLLTGLWLLLAWPWLSGTYTIPWDGKAHFAPQVQFLAASFARGELPWWTPNVFGGHPQIADPQSMIFSAPMSALAVLNASPSLWAIDVTVLLTVLFGGAGIIVFAYRQQWHWAAGLIAALVFMFGGSMAWRLQHFGQVMSLAYLPWALLFIDTAVRSGRIWAGAAAGTMAAFILLGRDQVGLLSIYVLTAFALWRLLEGGGRLERMRRALPSAITGLLLAAVIVAIPLAMTLALAGHSNRPSIDFAGAGAGSLHPGLLITTLYPNLYGAAGDMDNYWGPPSLIWEDTGLYIAQNMGVLYMGVLPLLALAVAAARGWLADRSVLFFAIAAAVCLLYALGRYTPLFSVAYEILPGVDKFRRPADATFLVGALLAFVVGWSIHQVITMVDKAHQPRMLGLAAGLIALGLIAAICIAAYWGRLGVAVPELAISLLTAVAAIGAASLALWLRPIRPRTAAFVLVVVVATDLALHNGPNGANALPAAAIDMLEPSQPHPTVAKLKALVATHTDDQYRPRVELVGLGYHWPNASLTHGLENTLGANPIRLAWYNSATGAGDTVAAIDQRNFSALMPSYTSRLAQLLGLKFIASGAPIPTETGPGAGLRLISRIGGHHIYEVPRALPRVMFATTAVYGPGTETAGATTLPDLDYRNTVLLPASAVGAKPYSEPAGREQGFVRIERYTNTQVIVETRSDNAGWVVLHDIWHPWWRATIDGKPARLLQANLIFRAVEVSAGRHTVEFSFEPFGGLWDDLVRLREKHAIDAKRP